MCVRACVCVRVRVCARVCNLRILPFTWWQPNKSININIIATVSFEPSKRHDAKHSNFSHISIRCSPKLSGSYVIRLQYGGHVSTCHTRLANWDAGLTHRTSVSASQTRSVRVRRLFNGHSRADEPMARVPRTARGKSSLARGIHRCPNPLFLLPDQCLCIVKNCVHMHIPDCVQTVYDLTLLPYNTTSEIFLHKSEAVWSADWIFIVGVPAWR
jgi:hypothetical protein